MPDYKFYAIKENGHVSGPPDIVFCDSDPAALETARRLQAGSDIEIWQGRRLIAYVTPENRSRTA